MKRLICLLMVLLAVSCSAPIEPVETPSTPPPATPEATPEAAVTQEPHPIASFDVLEGDQLERDIIPRLMDVFSLSEEQVKQALAQVRSSELIAPGLKDFRRMEGLFVPGTYDVFAETTVQSLIEAQLTLSEKRLHELSAQVTRNERTPQEAVILASIVEAECLDNRYYQETADVFNNRLARDNALQSCVTTEYAMGKQRFFLYAKDTEIESPYNTYRVKGLPAGPIATFDDASLKAALRQVQDDQIFYFFYDYVDDEMRFFADYREFKKEANASMQKFIEQDPRDPRAPINKQEIYR